jgi:hypothetical protein
MPNSSKDVSAPWAADADVRDMTDTDIVATRSYNTKVSDTSHELHHLIETLRREQGLDTQSATADRALRVELAYTIDERRVKFSREDFDVAYTIPPASWVQEQMFPTVDVLDEDEVDVSGRTLGLTTPSVVREMVDTATDNGPYETMTEMVKQGAKRMLGQL